MPMERNSKLPGRNSQFADPGQSPAPATFPDLPEVLDLVDETLGHDHERIPLEPSAFKLMLKMREQKDEVNFLHHQRCHSVAQ